MGLDHPNAADSLPGLGEYMRQVAADAGAEPKRSRRQEKKQERQEQKQEKQEHKLEKKQEKQDKKLENQQEKQEHKLEKKQEKQEHKQEKEERKQEKKQEREKDREEEKQRQRQQLEVMRQQQQEQQQELRHGTVTVAALVSEPRVNVASLGLGSPDAAHLAVPAGGREAAQQLPQPSVLAPAQVRTVADQTAAADHQPDAAAAPPQAAVAPGPSPPPAVAPAPAPPPAAAAQQQLFPEAHAPAAAASNAAVNGWRRSTGGSSSQQEELAGEPSLSLPHSLRPSASEEAAGLEGPAAHTATAVAEHTSSSSSSEGHVISQRYGGTAASGPSGLQQLATGPPVPDFQPQRQAAASAAAQSSWRASASDAFDAALAVEAPTPKFASKPWQQRQQQPQQQQQQPQQPPPQQQHDLQRRPVVSGPLGGGGAVPTPPPLQAQQRQQAERQGMSVGEAPPQRPALQLRLSASRSLDPDFTTSAEHTRFGEAPPAALPNYGGSSSGSSMRRTLSARADNSSSPGSSLRGADVGESLSRSLAYLKRQSSLQHSPGEQSDQEDAAAGEGRQAPGTLHAEQQQQAVQQQAVQQQAVQQQAVQRQQTSPSAANGDQPRRLRQQGSLKEQAGESIKRLIG
jgi:hypothetical protein